MISVNASPDDVKEVERIMQNLRKNRNNYRKLHGQPMKRLRALEKARNNELPITSWRRWLDMHRNTFINIGTVGYDAKPFAIGVDLAEGQDWCSSKIVWAKNNPYLTYGQKLINQNAVVKIVTNGEENGDA